LYKGTEFKSGEKKSL